MGNLQYEAIQSAIQVDDIRQFEGLYQHAEIKMRNSLANQATSMLLFVAVQDWALQILQFLLDCGLYAIRRDEDHQTILHKEYFLSHCKTKSSFGVSP